MKYMSAILGLAAMGLLVPLAFAHFTLVEPKSWIEEDAKGDPQKLGPCGGTSAVAGTPTNAITKVQGGQKLHVKVMETVYHPGHYRISLAVNSREELPADPEATVRDTDKGPRSISAKVVNPPMAPVLMDGLFDHKEKAGNAWETDVTLPNISCPKCTLQVVQFMEEHGYNKDGGYTYHHCADLNITADPSKPIAAGWPKAK